MVLGEGTVFASLLLIGLSRLERYIRMERVRLSRERNMLLGVTHELKTPLASVQLGVDTLRRLDLTSEDQGEVLANMQTGLSDLERRVEDMLLATRLQRHSGLQAMSFHWVEAVDDAMQRMTTLDVERIERESVGDVSEQANVVGDRALWILAAANLMENALKYSNGQVIVRAHCNAKEARLEVQDEGMGIAAEDREAALTPFVRLQEDGSGTGLGLYLVAQTAEMHGARLEMDCLKPSGFCVRLVWPHAS